ncbi:diguanylate cyclase [Pseudoxanthomonas sp. NC8]|nr:diguanylate cyclase [Pseudoxanthomonas sp. NC8]
MQLPLDARDLKFEFAAPAFQPMRPTHLRFRLDGYDRDWRELDAPHLRNATYTNLPPGDYSFEVANANAVDPALGVTRLPFSIAPRWHETLAFRLLLPLLAGVVFYLLYHWLQHRHTRQRAALEQLVQERTRDLQAANARLEALSFTDPLTGLHNRRYLSRQIPADLSFYERDPAYQAGTEAVVFALLDVDHFKAINDTHGHAAGDRILEQLGALLTTPSPQGRLRGALGRGRVPAGVPAVASRQRAPDRRAGVRGNPRPRVRTGRRNHVPADGVSRADRVPAVPGSATPARLGADGHARRPRAVPGQVGRPRYPGAFRPRAAAQPPPGVTAFEGDPSWLVEAGLVELFGAGDRAASVTGR